MNNKNRYRRGENHPQYRHGLGSTKDRNVLYSKWSGMKRRCLNSNDSAYPRYGGKGITVSPEWMDFVNFYRDMADTYVPGMSIERIDNSKGYSKENCKWIPLSEQAKNKSNVKMYEFNGKKLNITEWALETGIKPETIRKRLRTGWQIDKALTEPLAEYDGVILDKARGLWRSEIKRNGKKYFLGRFRTRDEAVNAREEFIKTNQTDHEN